MKFVINIIIAVILIAAIFFGYKFIMGPEETPTAKPGVVAVRPGASTTPGALGAPVGPSNEEFLALLTAVKGISFKNTILDDELFLGLENFHRPLPERSVGRENPFAPFAGGGRGTITGAPATTTQSGSR